MQISYLEFNFIQVEQPIGTFYIASIPYSALLKISEADIREIEIEDKKDDSFDTYLGIQRKLSDGRIKEISQYVTTVDATFPTSIILHINSISKYLDSKLVDTFDDDDLQNQSHKIEEVVNIRIDTARTKLLIRDEKSIARILDGQHRIEGLKEALARKIIDPESDFRFDFNVTIFVDLDMDDQAQIFSVINKAQTKVNKSLVYDLYDYAKSRSPQKTGHDIVRLLNRVKESPFYKKIKILGTAKDTQLETIAQATFVELIIDYISSNAMQDRDILKRKSIFGTKGKLTFNESDESKKIFRRYFVDEKDDIIASILWNYFEAVQAKWPLAWKEVGNGLILNKSTGIIALMKFLRPVYNDLKKNTNDFSVESFKTVFKNISLKDADFNKEKYIPGSTGQSQLLGDLKSQSGI